MQILQSAPVILERPTSSLSGEHREVLLNRGLDAAWIDANCRSVSAAEASQYLGIPTNAFVGVEMALTSATNRDVVLAKNTEQQKKELFGG